MSRIPQFDVGRGAAVEEIRLRVFEWGKRVEEFLAALAVGDIKGISTFIATLLDDVDAAAARATLGLGSAALKNIGTSGDTVPLLNTYDVFSGGVEFWTNAAYGTVATIKGVHNSAGPIFRREWAPTSAPSNFNDIVLEQYYAKNNALTLLNVFDQFAQWVDVTAGSEDVRFGWQSMIAGVKAVRFLMGAGIFANGATGGDKGDGTGNFKAVYDDNTLLTCYVLDAALDGVIDLAKWDAKVPPGRREYRIETKPAKVDLRPVAPGRSEIVVVEPPEFKHFVVEEPRQHDPVRKFAARLGSEYDPLDMDKYAAHWREKRHLTSLPNEAKFEPHSTGEWVQRLVETVEIQAVHIDTLNRRTKQQAADLTALTKRVQALEAAQPIAEAA